MKELPDVKSFMARAAIECGFEREKFIDKNVPETFDKIAVVLLLGDMRSLSVASLLLFKQFRDLDLKGKYVIVCSYPGMSCLFSGADEYWSLSDTMTTSEMMLSAEGFVNPNSRFDQIVKQLNRRFDLIVTGEDFLKYYNNGLTTGYFNRFKKVERYFPQISGWRGNDLARKIGQPIFIYPNTKGKFWARNKEQVVSFPKEFWVKLVEELLKDGFVPVVYQNISSYDLSPMFGEKCLYCTDRNFSAVLSAMHATGCVLDMFSGISRMSIVARCPFLAMDERQRYVQSKESEVNDLCIAGMYPYRYGFSFPPLIESGNYSQLISHLMNVLKKFIPKSRVELPPFSESFDEVSYDVVRQNKAKKLGINFIRVERLEI